MELLKELQASNATAVIPGKGFSQTDVVDFRNGGKVLANCFSMISGGEWGWCATCVHGAKKGTPGYCGEGEQKIEAEAPKIDASSNNWGFCNPDCGSRQVLGNILQVCNQKMQANSPFSLKKMGTFNFQHFLNSIK